MTTTPETCRFKVGETYKNGYGERVTIEDIGSKFMVGRAGLELSVYDFDGRYSYDRTDDWLALTPEEGQS